MKTTDGNDHDKVVANNRKAFHDYHILDRYEAGMSLVGTEVKSLRRGNCSIKESFARIDEGEAFVYDMHIPPYEQGGVHNHEPTRRRKLLLHRGEIERLIGKTREKGLTLVVTKVYFKRGKAKIEIGLAKGKQLHDKRKTMAERDAKREIDRGMAERNKGDIRRKT